MDLGCFQRGRLHDVRGQLFQCSAVLSGETFSLMLRWNLLYFSLWPPFLILLLEKVWTALLALTLEVFVCVNEIPESFSRLPRPRCHSLS